MIRDRSPAWDLAVAFPLAVALDLVVSLPDLPRVLGGSLINPDSYMRLVRLQEMIAHQAPLDAVAADAGGSGTVLAWSHLLDALLLALAAALRIVAGPADALFAAAALVGPLSVGLLAVALCWAIGPVCDRRWRWLAAVVVPLSRPIATYGQAGSATHHVLLVANVAMVAGWCARAGRLGPAAGAPAGVWAGLGAWLSPETVPLSLGCFGVLGVAWLSRPARPLLDAAMAAAGGFLVIVVAACVLDPPRSGILSAAVDRVSVVYVVLGLILCGMAVSLRAIGPACRTGRDRLLLVGAVVAAGAVAWVGLTPDLLRGAAALAPAAEARLFFGEIAEMRPVRQSGTALALLLTGGLGTAVCVVLAVRQRSWSWAYAAACAAATLVLAAAHRRFAIYPAGIGAAACPAAITLVTRAAWPLPARLVAGLGVVAMFDFGLRLPGPAATAPIPSCDLRHASALFRPFAGKVVLGSPGDTPELLYRTGVLTVGSLYHRNIDAYLRLRGAWRSEARDETGQVPAAVRAAHIDLVLACPLSRRLGLVEDLPADTLYDRLNRMEPPPWLRAVGSDPRSGLVLFQVTDPAGRP